MATARCLTATGRSALSTRLPDLPPSGMTVRPAIAYDPHVEAAAAKHRVLMLHEGTDDRGHGGRRRARVGCKGGKRIEHCRGEHVTGDAADEVEVDFHYRLPSMRAEAPGMHVAVTPNLPGRERPPEGAGGRAAQTVIAHRIYEHGTILARNGNETTTPRP